MFIFLFTLNLILNLDTDRVSNYTWDILNMIANKEPATKRNKSIPANLQLLIALRFYNTGVF